MDLDNLGKIKRVEAPPFLFARIQKRVDQSNKERMPKNITLAVSLSFVLILFFNAITLLNYNSKTQVTENFVQSMQLTSNNSLY